MSRSRRCSSLAAALAVVLAVITTTTATETEITTTADATTTGTGTAAATSVGADRLPGPAGRRSSGTTTAAAAVSTASASRARTTGADGCSRDPGASRPISATAVAIHLTEDRLASRHGRREADVQPTVSYRAPVDALIIDPFRPPSTPYGPGNRGIEYATAPGTEVVAPADGVVTFAGLVAGASYVTVLHADGIRTTASYLVSVRVVAGRHVGQGEVIGTSGPRLHVSARRDDVYLDPASLWGTGPVRILLVPLDGGSTGGITARPTPPPTAPPFERPYRPSSGGRRGRVRYARQSPGTRRALSVHHLRAPPSVALSAGSRFVQP